MRACSVLLCAAYVGGVPLSLASVAAAQDSADVSAARALGVEGVKLADAGKCDEAIDRLSRAEKLHHAPSVLERLGECQITLGKIVDGTETLQKVVREELAPNAPTPFVVAKQRAQKVLDAARPRVAKLVIQLVGGAPESVVLKVDGQIVSSAYIGTARPTDPGDHVVEVSAPGFKKVSQPVTVGPGASETVSLTLETDPHAAPTDNQPTGTVPVTGGGEGTGNPGGGPTPRHETPTSHGGAVKTDGEIVSFTIAGLGVAVGATFGLLAMSKKSTLDGVCFNKACPRGTQSTIDDANTFGTVSTVAFIVGGVGLLAGIIFLAIPGPKAAPATGISVAPVAGLGSLGLTGTF